MKFGWRPGPGQGVAVARQVPDPVPAATAQPEAPPVGRKGIPTPLSAMWRRADISVSSTSYGEIPQDDGVNAGFPVGYSGELVGIAVCLDGDVGGAGVDYSVQVYVDRQGAGYAASGIEATITGAVGTQQTAYSLAAGVRISPGDRVTVYDKRTGAVSARGGRAVPWVRWDPL